jgi:chemotaxis protein MotA
MNIPIGWIIALVSTAIGFYAAVGDFGKLWVPAEFAIIGGAGLGALIAANKGRNLKNIFVAIGRVFGRKQTSKEENNELLSLMFELLLRIKRDGRKAIEADIESGAIFNNYPRVGKRVRLVEFLQDYFSMRIAGTITASQLDAVMSQEIDVLDRELREPAESLDILADSMPAFGIVAAIIGVIAALGSLSEAGTQAADVGSDVGKALIGTLLGVFIAYAFLAPVARTLHQLADSELRPFKAVKEILIADLSNFTPMIAVEYGRKVLYTDQRPSMRELDDQVRSSSGQRFRE